MRILLSILAFASFISVKAQTPLPYYGLNYMPGNFNSYSLLADSSKLQKKWSVSTYAGIGAGFMFFNGANAAFMPAQIGVQLNRRLNNNLYAFAGMSATPAYFNINRTFSTADPNKNFMDVPGVNANGWGVSTGVYGGLMYVNDARTFSISGSIGVGRSYAPFYAPASLNTQKQLSSAGFRQ